MTIGRAGFVGTVAIVVGLAGCGGSSSQPVAPEGGDSSESAAPEPAASASPEATPAAEAADPAAPTAQEAEDLSPVEKAMRNHFKEADLVRKAVIAGSPENAAKQATLLSESYELNELPAGWETSVRAMQDAAKRVNNSADVTEAAAATADIGVACGACHQSQGGPDAAGGEPPPLGDTVQTRMARHAWATERLWEGLYVPSATAWAAGVAALKEPPFPEEILKRSGVYGRNAAKEFSALVKTAGSKKTPADRAATYAKLLGTCAQCHVAVWKK